MNWTRSFLLAAVGLVVGIVGAVSFNTYKLQAQSTVTFRKGVMSTGAELLDNCNPFPFTAAKHPTQIIEIELPGTFDPHNLQPVMTQMSITDPPWTSGNPTTKQTYNPAINWTPRTKLDMDLNLAPPGGTNRSMVLIKVIVRDPAVTFRTDGFAITSGDVNGRKMFCKFAGGYGTKEVTFVAFYYKATPHQPTMGTFNLGLIVQDADLAYILPIFVDPVVENNGFN
jgi:hypothetical protein